MFSVRVGDDLAARFDAAASAAGGRSAFLRRLVLQAAAEAQSAGRTAPTPARDAARIMVRLARAEATAVAEEAMQMGLTRSGWVAGLVRARVTGAPQFNRPSELALRAMQGELRRIGVNVNQIAHALNTAVMEGRVLDLEMASLEDFRVEIRSYMGGLREAFEGALGYWATDW